jgi:hypothetical protein
MGIKLDVKHVFSGSPKPPDSRFMKALAESVLLKMQEKVYNGRDIYNKRFQPYSLKYREYKKGKGRLSKKRAMPEGAMGRGVKVDLTFTGQMLASWQIVKVSTMKFIIGFAGGRSDTGDSNAQIAWINNLIRKFVGLSEKDKAKAIKDAFRHAIKKGWFG